MNDLSEDDYRDIESALNCADAGDAGWWPTVADVLATEVRRLRARVAELEAGEMEWGVERPAFGSVARASDEADARTVARSRTSMLGAFVVKRRAPGPWLPADKTGATS